MLLPSINFAMLRTERKPFLRSDLPTRPIPVRLQPRGYLSSLFRHRYSGFRASSAHQYTMIHSPHTSEQLLVPFQNSLRFSWVGFERPHIMLERSA